AEILDALLMAFPALGLAKIVWAVDIILAMDLPQFRLDAPAAASATSATSATSAASAASAAAATWHDLMAADALAVGAARRVECDGRGLFVYRADDEWRVYDSRCPHQATDIPQPALQGTTLTCPKHGWAFDLRSGACIAIGDRALERRPSRVEHGRLLAHW
ncbi:MAG: Rieske (2Fe-2S) protein, partial [Proteobacteria bacterium]|nr:Rieske (2Fe-2S) protein [Pseudomonadota bacterium]